MQNEQSWKPSKYEITNNRLGASKDPNVVSISSRLMAQKVAEFFNEAVPQHANGRLLDLGCGAAPLFGFYKDFASEVICVDWGGSSHNLRYIDLEHDLTEPLPFENHRFDTVILSDVLEHVPEPGALWQEISRVLAPGGKLLLNVPFYYWLHERPFDFYRYTEFALKRFADQCSLDILELRRLGGAPEILSDILAKVVITYRFGKPFASAIQAAGGWLAKTRPGASLSRKTAGQFPFGYALVAQKPGTR